MADSGASVWGSPAGGRCGSEICARPASPADARTIATIAVLGWRAAYRGMLPDDYLDGLSIGAREQVWRTMLEADPGGALPAWIAERAGVPMGFVSAGPPRDEDLPRGTVEIYAIYVLPEVWRSGAGRVLLGAAVHHAWSRGAPALVLWVLEVNGRGRAFYQAMGWRHDGRRQELALAGVTITELRYRLNRPTGT